MCMRCSRAGHRSDRQELITALRLSVNPMEASSPSRASSMQPSSPSRASSQERAARRLVHPALREQRLPD